MFYLPPATLQAQPVLHVPAELDGLVPGARGLEALGHAFVVKAEVSDIGDHEGEDVAALPVSPTSVDSPTDGGDVQHLLLLVLHALQVPLVEESDETDLLEIQLAEFCQVENLGYLGQALTKCFLGLERLTKQELLVVDESKKS